MCAQIIKTVYYFKATILEIFVRPRLSEIALHRSMKNEYNLLRLILRVPLNGWTNEIWPILILDKVSHFKNSASSFKNTSCSVPRTHFGKSSKVISDMRTLICSLKRNNSNQYGNNLLINGCSLKRLLEGLIVLVNLRIIFGSYSEQCDRQKQRERASIAEEPVNQIKLFPESLRTGFKTLPWPNCHVRQVSLRT